MGKQTAFGNATGHNGPGDAGLLEKADNLSQLADKNPLTRGDLLFQDRVGFPVMSYGNDLKTLLLGGSGKY
jgi:hypothetical protein